MNGYDWHLVHPEDEAAKAAPIVDELPADPKDGETIKIRVDRRNDVVWTFRYVAPWEIERGFGASTYRRRDGHAQIEIDARDDTFGDPELAAVTREIGVLVEALELAGVKRLEIGIPRIEP